MIRFLSDVTKADVAEVGGKAASLGEMLQAKMPVPDGFVITTQAYKQGLTDELKWQALAAFEKLGAQRVAVRSSAVAEDSSSASWAGQLDTVLNVTKDGLVEAVEFCWKSMQSKRAQSYARENNVPKSQQAVAVVVQAMVDSDISGVMFTANPINNNPKETIIEVIYGLGELLVQGAVTPESYTLQSRSGREISFTQHRQTKKLTYENGKNQEIALEKSSVRIITNKQLKQILEQGKKIEKYYGKPQDIEFAIANNKLFIVQSRPITTLENVADLPEFFNHCGKALARPSTLQRDEIVRFTANAVSSVRVVTLPLEGRVRAYYFEKDDAKKLLLTCLHDIASPSQLEKHLNDYEATKLLGGKVRKTIEQKPDEYTEIFKQYREFLTRLSPFLFTGVAIDAVLFPKFKESVEKKYTKEGQRILDIVATPKALHDYQKLRLAICELKVGQTSEKAVGEIAKTYAHVNEYSFVETLITPKTIKAELKELTKEVAQAEIADIKKSIDDNAKSTDWLEEFLPEPLLTQAKLIKEYALLRTDRIDQLKRVQTQLRTTFEQLAKEMSKTDSNLWSRQHVANLLDQEIDEFISKRKVPSFGEVGKRFDQKYLYYYMNHTATVLTDRQVVKQAQDIVIIPENSKIDSLISVGTTAFPGTVSGKVVRITDLEDLQKVQTGDIMVAYVTMPDYTPAMRIAGGFITAQGGVTSHAAIVARELGKPCIVGADNCMEALKDGDYIFLDAGNQIVTHAQQTNSFELGEPDQLFYWGPSRAKVLYMGDFTVAAEKFFQNAYKVPSLPNPPKTLVLFYEGKVVWLINAVDFGAFVEKLFEAYLKRDKLDEDVADWRKVASSLDQLEGKDFTKALLETWRHTLFAEFSLYGAESSLAKQLARFDSRTRQEIWGAFTVPENSTFLGRMDEELKTSKDPETMAKKYPWIEDGYDGLSKNAVEYFTKRLKVLLEEAEDRIETKKDRENLARKLMLKKEEVQSLTVARKLAEFMDDRKAWMMQTRRLIKTPIGDTEHGWFYEDGNAVSINEEDANELWKRYVDFKASTNIVKGLVASSGSKHFVNGEVVIVGSPTDIVSNNKVLVVPSTSPSYVPLMRKARALVTDHGGMMSHAAIVARELGLPCIVGTKQATKVLKTGDKVVLDLVRGEVNK